MNEFAEIENLEKENIMQLYDDVAINDYISAVKENELGWICQEDCSPCGGGTVFLYSTADVTGYNEYWNQACKGKDSGDADFFIGGQAGNVYCAGVRTVRYCYNNVPKENRTPWICQEDCSPCGGGTVFLYSTANVTGYNEHWNQTCKGKDSADADFFIGGQVGNVYCAGVRTARYCYR